MSVFFAAGRFGSLARRFVGLLVLLVAVSVIPWVVAGRVADELGGVGVVLDAASSLRFRTLAIQERLDEPTLAAEHEQEAVAELVAAQLKTLAAVTDGDPSRGIPPCARWDDVLCAELRGHRERWEHDLAPRILAAPSHPATIPALIDRLEHEFDAIDTTVHGIADHDEGHVSQARTTGKIAVLVALALLALVGAGVWHTIARIRRLQRAAASHQAEVEVAALAHPAGDEIDALAAALAGSLREQRLRGDELAGHLAKIEEQKEAMERLAADGALAASLARLGEVDQAVAQLGERLRRLIDHAAAVLWLREGADVGPRAWRVDAVGATHLAPPVECTVAPDCMVARPGDRDACRELLGDTEHALIIPLRAAAGVIGCVALGRDGEGFDDDDVAIARGVAPLITEAIERMRMGEQLRLAQQVAVVGGFGRMLAHELRNPLNSLALQVRLLERSLNGAHEQDAKVAGRLAAVDTEIERLMDLVDHYQSLTASDGTGEFAPTDVRALVADALDTQRPVLERLDVDLEVDLGDEPVIAEVDASRITLVLRNLIDHAVHELAAAPRRRMSVQVRSVDGRSSIALRHSGPRPIDPARAFLPGDGQPAGDGMSLPVGLQIARLHGGSLVARNPAGGGAELVLSLPLRHGADNPIRR